MCVEYLGTCSGQDAERLLSEAVALQNDSELSLEAARKFSGQHPGLYEQILKQNLMSGKDDELFDVGQEALRTIQPQYIVRSRVALMTAVYALRLKKQNEAELCWLEAFRSDTRPVHYLRMVVESLDFSGYREETRLIYRNCFKQAKKEKNHQYQVGELRENRIDKQTYFMLAFFGGEFRHVIEDGMNEKAPLGWSFTFMKVGIGLFLCISTKEMICRSGAELCAAGHVNQFRSLLKNILKGLGSLSISKILHFFGSVFVNGR